MCNATSAYVNSVRHGRAVDRMHRSDTHSNMCKYTYVGCVFRVAAGAAVEETGRTHRNACFEGRNVSACECRLCAQLDCRWRRERVHFVSVIPQL